MSTEPGPMDAMSDENAAIVRAMFPPEYSGLTAARMRQRLEQVLRALRTARPVAAAGVSENWKEKAEFRWELYKNAKVDYERVLKENENLKEELEDKHLAATPGAQGGEAVKATRCGRLKCGLHEIKMNPPSDPPIYTCTEPDCERAMVALAAIPTTNGAEGAR